MAIANEILVGRFNRALQKLFGLKGKSGAPQLASEIMPVWPFLEGVEDAYLEGWDRFGVGALQSAVVGAISGFRLRNPANSNVIAVVERISFSETATDTIIVQQGAIGTDLTTPVTPGRLDARGRSASTLLPSMQSNPPSIGSVLGGFLVPASVGDFPIISTDHQELPLLPGDAFNIIGSLQNTALRVNVLWRERFLDDQERA